MRLLPLLLLLGAFTPSAQAGLYDSGEKIADLPSQWRGYLVDQRHLRTVAVPIDRLPQHPFRDSYDRRRDVLERKAKDGKASADEIADLGALWIRFGKPDQALNVLSAGHRANPDHFRMAANLGTAWQFSGDLSRAAEAIRVAIKLAPPELKRSEEIHLKLIEQRSKQQAGTQSLDDLFGVKFTDNAPSIPPDAVAVVQRLALALPADGRLVWQLAELAAATGDIRTAAAMMDGCAGEFNLTDPVFRKRRQEFRDRADGHAHAPAGADTPKFKFLSQRPLPVKPLAGLPAIKVDGVNTLPWALLGQTTLDRQFKPGFPDHLKKLDGHRVVLVGYLQPIGDSLESNLFLLIEFPVGCWFCETPEPTGVVQVEMPEGKAAKMTREPVRVVGKLTLNSKDPEDFIFIVREATVALPD